MEKEFVPYELSLELKQLGFDEPCFGSYVKLTATQTTFFVNDVVDEINRETPLHESLITKAPLYQQAFRWFREKYEIDSAILPTGSTPYQFRLYHKLQDTIKVQLYSDYMGKEYKTYEEAELACLQNLIEIVKTK